MSGLNVRSVGRRNVILRVLKGSAALVGGVAAGLWSRPSVSAATLQTDRATTSGLTVSHMGICVTDLDRSVQFYCDALGFERSGNRITVGNETARFMEVAEPVKLNLQFITRDGLRLELLNFQSPTTLGPASRRPMNQLGFTHLALRVDSAERVAALIRQHGGHVMDHTRGLMRGYLYCTDPDGVRIELIESRPSRG